MLTAATGAAIATTFEHDLGQQAIVVAVLLAIGVGARITDAVITNGETATVRLAAGSPEPAGRELLRIGFGLLWVVDGLLQMQRAMPTGLPSQVVGPAADGSPGWVHSIVNAGLHIWIHHPVPSALAVAWIQLGVGAFLLLAPHGRLSQLAGWSSVAWGLTVWVFGEAFGSMLSPGQSWLTGAPGGALLYAVAGGLVTVSPERWKSPRLGRWILGGIGVVLLGATVLQLWPGWGNWQGHAGAHHAEGALTSMVKGMAMTPQPGWLGSLVSSFGSFDAAHGWAVNLFFVLSLAAIGLALLSGRRRLMGVATIYATLLWLAIWFAIQDLGVLGGLGTDPNSMIPAVLLLLAGWLAFRHPGTVAAFPLEPMAPALASEGEGNPHRVSHTTLRIVAAAGAVAVLLMGAVPMAVVTAQTIAGR
jgi:hypothetical protein